MGCIRGGGKTRYAVWKGEHCIAIGTATELAERFGVTVKYIWWMASPTAKRRDKGNRMIAERI